MTSKTTIKLRVGKKRGDKTTPELHFNFGPTLPASITLFGEEAIHAAFVSSARQQLSDWARKLLTRKKLPQTIEQLQAALDAGEWEPGVRRRGKTALDKATAFLEGMTPEERLKLAEIAKMYAPPNPGIVTVTSKDT
jgi:hypothetical protein